MVENWKAGVEHFNSGRFWEAHEAWERGWMSLPRLEKLHIQILIQVAGVFYLLEKKRLRGARSLLASAQFKMKQLDELGGISHIFPRVQIDDLAKGLNDLEIFLGTSDPFNPSINLAKFARARLLLSSE